jgi:uncharacterized protein (TIGR01732 family)
MGLGLYQMFFAFIGCNKPVYKNMTGLLIKEVTQMYGGYGYPGVGCGFGFGGFALIVVLFILLIIVGCAFWC